MSMIDGLRNVLGINQDPEADSYVDDNEEDDIFPGGGQGGSADLRNVPNLLNLAAGQ